MKLHTAGSEPEWQAVAAKERNHWQRLAAATHGLLTVANIVTVAGLCVVILGLISLQRHHWIMGLILVALGRGADVADGFFAEITGTKSPLGEQLDASVDKIGTGITLVALPVLRIMPWWAALILVLPQLLAIIVAYGALSRGIRVHPSRIGKLGMAAAWLCLLCFIAQRMWPTSRLLTASTYGLLVLGVSFAFVAIFGYLQTIRHHFS